MSKAQRILAGSLLLLVLCLLVWRRADALRFNGAPEPNEQPFIKLDQAAGAIEVAGLNARHLAKLRKARLSAAEWAELFAFFATPKITADTPAVLGTHSATETALRFTPRFPLVAGLRYTARFNVARWRERFGEPPLAVAPVLETVLTLPPVTTNASTVVAAVYPSADELPANQLKLYLDFSAPMSVGEAFQHLHLRDNNGRAVPRAFLRLDQELWDATRQRFTLLFDPGRVKRGLRSNLEDGAPLQPGRRYQLVIDADWRDGAGQPLRAGFEKAFTVGAPDRTSPVYTAWQVSTPAAGTTEPLCITFDEPLDHALLEEFLTVFEGQGQRLGGTTEIGLGERQWLFRPAQSWRAGPHEVRVNPKLEDRAGNNLLRLFDAEVQSPSRTTTQLAQISLPFVIRSRSAGQ